jgi:hypothetical protein
MVNTNPRIPCDEREVFAMSFMVGYLGDVPDYLAECFPGEDFRNCPAFIREDIAHEWKRGYDAGVAFYCDHAMGEEE